MDQGSLQGKIINKGGGQEVSTEGYAQTCIFLKWGFDDILKTECPQKNYILKAPKKDRIGRTEEGSK